MPEEERPKPPAEIVDLAKAREGKIAEQQRRIRDKIKEMRQLYDEIYQQPQHSPSMRKELEEISSHIGRLSTYLGDKLINDQELEDLLKFLRRTTGDQIE